MGFCTGKELGLLGLEQRRLRGSSPMAVSTRREVRRGRSRALLSAAQGQAQRLPLPLRQHCWAQGCPERGRGLLLGELPEPRTRGWAPCWGRGGQGTQGCPQPQSLPCLSTSLPAVPVSSPTLPCHAWAGCGAAGTSWHSACGAPRGPALPGAPPVLELAPGPGSAAWPRGGFSPPLRVWLQEGAARHRSPPAPELCPAPSIPWGRV